MSHNLAYGQNYRNTKVVMSRLPVWVKGVYGERVRAKETGASAQPEYELTPIDQQ